MKCSVCSTEDATIHLTEIVNSKMMELHLCEQCAYEKGTDIKQYFNFSDLLAGIADKDTVESSLSTEVSKCSQCNSTFEDFSKSGRLGCPHCYVSFKTSLNSLVKRIHRSTKHIGKRPKKVPGELKPQIELRKLQEQLRILVEKEAFEEAVKVRDLIKKLEVPKKKVKKKNGS